VSQAWRATNTSKGGEGGGGGGGGRNGGKDGGGGGDGDCSGGGGGGDGDSDSDDNDGDKEDGSPPGTAFSPRFWFRRKSAMVLFTNRSLKAESESESEDGGCCSGVNGGPREAAMELAWFKKVEVRKVVEVKCVMVKCEFIDWGGGERVKGGVFRWCVSLVDTILLPLHPTTDTTPIPPSPHQLSRPAAPLQSSPLD
jgi:hypothetical protein